MKLSKQVLLDNMLKDLNPKLRKRIIQDAMAELTVMLIGGFV
ncbi:hypothetical protein [Pedobacter sp. PACM 27299]|nr:hypothetical protein [Pedobacter sp. PACM 27299]